MIISDKHRFIFIKGVKVAGTSVESYLSQVLEPEAIVAGLPGNQAATIFPNHRSRNYLSASGDRIFNDHMPATAIRSVIGAEKYEQYFKFGIIRNPYDKIRSLFYMRVNEEDPNYTIDQAIEECDSEKVRLCDGESMIVHRAIFYENLDQQLGEVLSQLNVPFSGKLLYHERSSHRTAYKGPAPLFSDAQQVRVTEKFAFEFALYHSMASPVRDR
jgi:hypothetical protein